MIESQLGWWTISGEALLYMLRRAASGEDPDLVYAEFYANCRHCPMPSEDDDG